MLLRLHFPPEVGVLVSTAQFAHQSLPKFQLSACSLTFSIAVFPTCGPMGSKLDHLLVLAGVRILAANAGVKPFHADLANLKALANFGAFDGGPMLARLLLSSCLLTSMPVLVAAQATTIRNRVDIDAFMKNYRLHPEPDLIPGFIQLLHTMEPAQKSGATHPVVGFFSELFLANPSHVPEWLHSIPTDDDQLKGVLDRALDLSKSGGVLSESGHSGFLNDEYWGAFFATGNSRFIDKLVEQLSYCDERNDLNLFLAGITAKWSLASVAQTDSVVRSILQDPKRKDSPQVKRQIAELLTASDPTIFKVQAREVIRQQRALGKWN